MSLGYSKRRTSHEEFSIFAVRDDVIMRSRSREPSDEPIVESQMNGSKRSFNSQRLQSIPSVRIRKELIKLEKEDVMSPSRNLSKRRSHKDSSSESERVLNSVPVENHATTRESTESNDEECLSAIVIAANPTVNNMEPQTRSLSPQDSQISADPEELQDLNGYVKEQIKKRERRCKILLFCLGCLLVLALGGGVVTAISLLQEGGTENGAGAKVGSGMPPAVSPLGSELLQLGDSPSEDTRKPIAVCRLDRIVISSGTQCQVDTIDPRDLDNGSFDPSGDDEALRFSISPPGPYQIGAHDLVLRVENSKGKSGVCLATVLIMEGVGEWIALKNHAYRLRPCALSWSKARKVTSSTMHCGEKAHMATFTSDREREFLRSQRPLNQVWMGAFLVRPVNLTVTNSTCLWEWVAGEGKVRDGVVDWFGIERVAPANTCLALRGFEVDFRFDGISCTKKLDFFEEIDLSVTIKLDGCDSQIPDRFEDANSCTLLINPRLENCGSRSSNVLFEECVEATLEEMVELDVISREEKLAIQYCGQPNEPPVAVCQDVVVSSGPYCNQDTFVSARDFDGGSTDPDGGDVSFSLFSEGPFSLGVHNIVLTVHDDQGSSASCEALLTVTDDGSISSGWRFYEGSAYRVRRCKQNWQTAFALARQSELCGKSGHLATVLTAQENIFISEKAESLPWLGGFRQEDAEWTWVNDEGLVFDGFVNIRSRTSVGCLYIKPTGLWKSLNCSDREAFVEEVDLAETVVFNGCDTGIMDRPNQDGCHRLIQDGIDGCALHSNVSDCVDSFLTTLVKEGSIYEVEKRSILFCRKGNLPPVAVCQNNFELSIGSGCSGVSLSSSDIDNGSFDPDGDRIVIDFSPKTLPSVGLHNISLIVTDNQGAQGSCFLSVLVNDIVPPVASPWVLWNGSAYRVRRCGSDWQQANKQAALSTLCDTAAILTTIESREELEFVAGLVGDRKAFVGNPSPFTNSSDLLVEVNLDGNPPTCPVIVGPKLEQESCLNTLQYVEEVNFGFNVVIQGCDSGVPDVVDLSSCLGTISSWLLGCENSDSQEGFPSCAESVLQEFAVQGMISPSDIDKVLNCGQGNVPPTARCKSEYIARLGPECSGKVQIQASDINDGSFDPDDGDSLSFALVPPGPYHFGSHRVTLVVSDRVGANDTCTSTLFVTDDGSYSTKWLNYKNQAFRVRLCGTTWSNAAEFASRTDQCGSYAHLATITTPEEGDLIRRIGLELVWLGAFQPKGSSEPDGGWTWVNGEGLVEAGYVDWNIANNEPNDQNNDEDCLILWEISRGFGWNDEFCAFETYYMEEVDLSRTVVVNDCDSLVPDVLVDANSCSFLFGDAIQKCIDAGRTIAERTACTRTVVNEFVQRGAMSMDEAQSILSCVSLP